MSDDITLSPFQKRCIEREDGRIVLQPRRTGSTIMQAHLADDRASNDDTVLHVAPNRPGCGAFLDALPGEGEQVRSFATKRH